MHRLGLHVSSNVHHLTTNIEEHCSPIISNYRGIPSFMFPLYRVDNMALIVDILFMAQSAVLLGSGLYMLLSPEQAARNPQLVGMSPAGMLTLG